MGLLFRLVELLIVLVPLAGVIYAAVKGFSATQRRMQEPADLRHGERGDELQPAAPATGSGNSQAAQWRAITRMVEEHTRTDGRWLDYELDFATLLDLPLMTDMRNPLTIEFHKAKLRADLLRPDKAEDLLDDREAAAQYLAAVENYVTAFDAAEAEAKRTRRSDFSADGQQRIARAQALLRVASDASATAPERQQAYELARRELDGLLVLPTAAATRIERGIAGQLDT
ncbi:hypothetical protein [Mycolicibacterium komossense]|uniref:Secreted protein n=1 Tax=Mycolicibacterium komossense TaxID=1779 RepID=A0ABT3CAR2_9MYCO|nr:hypothetical protein [Mycolicibacterium komossense]MCV7226550.1 hypothetical protein [Mycolicibacterium komossense]